MTEIDRKKKIEAMYHLEVCFDAAGYLRPEGWLSAHITAAHYLVQSMFDGAKPDNYDEVIARAAELDAIDEANNAIHIAKQ